MKRGWLIYDAEGKERNAWFISECLRHAEAIGLPLSLKVVGKDALMDGCPDFALVRTISPALSKDLEGAGARLFNSASVSRIANDKWETYRFAKEMGLTVLPTALSLGMEEGSPFGYPVVVKSRAGHGGSEVFLLSSQEEYREFFKNHPAKDYITQAVCSETGKDMRVYVLGGKILAGVLRVSTNDFRSNFSLGGSVERVPVPIEIQKTVELLCGKEPFDFVGIDFIRHQGEWVLNEIEDVVGCRMLYKTSDLDVAKLYIEYVAERLRAGK